MSFTTRAVPTLLLLAMAGCDLPNDNPPPPIYGVQKHWQFGTAEYGRHEMRMEPEGTMGFGTLHEVRDLGGILIFPGRTARAEVYSNSTGETYWVLAESPSPPGADTVGVYGVDSYLRQIHWFRKTAEDAYLRFVISAVNLLAIDANATLPSDSECPTLDPDTEDCSFVMYGAIEFEIAAFAERVSDGEVCANDDCYYSIGGSVELKGYLNEYVVDVAGLGYTLDRAWDPDHFEVLDAAAGNGIEVVLTAPLSVYIPLSRVPIGDIVEIHSMVWASAANLRQAESFVSAYFRDPIDAGGVALEYDGVEPVPSWTQSPRERPESTPSCTPGHPSSGTVQFAAANFSTFERMRRARVEITRTGGDVGPASVRFTTADGTATAGQDYEAVSTYVHFAPGESGSRVVDVPLIGDTIAEPNETVLLQLAIADGCGSLGPQSTATLRILDDDRPPPIAPTYTVGGTVTGLLGSGLTLRLNASVPLQPGNGSFQFPTPLPTAQPYSVVITSQPSDPAQVCTIENGSGSYSGGDVDDVLVTCAAPAPGNLDDGFGTDGRVTAEMYEGGEDMLLQPDGKIIGLGQLQMTRFNPDGTLDTGFGVHGVVTMDFNGVGDRFRALGLQADGRILVAGATRTGVNSPTDWDLALARYLPDGTLDPSFGTGGRVVVDYATRGEEARAVWPLEDGSILVMGESVSMATGLADNDFTVARFSAAGVLDTSFGEDGWARVNVAGRTDIAYTAAVQPDGRILIGGRVADTGGQDPDVGLVRLMPDGSLDTSFGAGGVVRLLTDRQWDEIADLTLQPDGSILAAGLVFLGGRYHMMAMRFLPDGSLDPSFGTAGIATFDSGTDITMGYAIGLQGDGRILVGGAMGSNGATDFAVIRLHPDGSPDATFGDDGVVSVDFFGQGDAVTSIAIQPDGRILAGGYATNGTLRYLGIVRINQ